MVRLLTSGRLAGRERHALDLVPILLNLHTTRRAEADVVAEPGVVQVYK